MHERESTITNWMRMLFGIGEFSLLMSYQVVIEVFCVFVSAFFEEPQ